MINDQVTIGDRYAAAASSGNLTPRADRPTDADTLLAAAIASGAAARRAVMVVYRAAVTRDLQSLPGAIEELSSLITAGDRNNRRLSRDAARAVAAEVVRWYVDPTCHYCCGRGFEAADGRLTARECTGCHGSGRRPLLLSIPREHRHHAQRIAATIDTDLAWIHGQMARLLSARL